MSRLKILILCLTLYQTLFGVMAVAATKNKPHQKMSRGATKLGTDFHFNELTIRGKYQSPTEGVITVENEKEILDILDYRTEFKDRLKQSRNEI